MVEKFGNFPIFVMHYKPLSERKEMLLRQLKAIGANNCHFIEKFDKEEIDFSNISEYYQFDYDGWISKYFLIRKIITENMFFSEDKKSWSEGIPPDRFAHPDARALKASEVSLAMKHVEAYRAIVDKGFNYAMIVEDDIIFCDGFLEKFYENFSETPPDWDFVFFGGGCGFKVPERESGKTVYRMIPPRSKCSDSYLISQGAARKILDNIFPFTQPIDFEIGYWMNRFNMKCYWWEPALVTQGSQTGMFASSIQLDNDAI